MVWTTFLKPLTPDVQIMSFPWGLTLLERGRDFQGVYFFKAFEIRPFPTPKLVYDLEKRKLNAITYLKVVYPNSISASQEYFLLILNAREKTILS